MRCIIVVVCGWGARAEIDHSLEGPDGCTPMARVQSVNPYDKVIQIYNARQFRCEVRIEMYTRKYYLSPWVELEGDNIKGS